jgi:hypothetical protein
MPGRGECKFADALLNMLLEWLKDAYALSK